MEEHDSFDLPWHSERKDAFSGRKFGFTVTGPPNQHNGLGGVTVVDNVTQEVAEFIANAGNGYADYKTLLSSNAALLAVCTEVLPCMVMHGDGITKEMIDHMSAAIALAKEGG